MFRNEAMSFVLWLNNLCVFFCLFTRRERVTKKAFKSVDLLVVNRFKTSVLSTETIHKLVLLKKVFDLWRLSQNTASSKLM